MKKAKRSQKASRKGKDRAGKGQKQSKALIVTKRTQGVIKRQPKDEIIAQVLDSKEEALIASELAGQVIDKLAYQVFDKDGKLLMQDLTYQGIRELARAMVPIHFGEPKETYMAEEQLWAVRIEATNTKTGENAWGAAEVSARFQSGKSNNFPYRIAIVKAQRNAMKQLLPLSMRMQMFKTYLRTKPGKQAIVKVTLDQATVVEHAPQAVKHNTALAAVFAKIAELGLNKDKAHIWLRKKHNTEHLSSLQVEVLRSIWNDLAEAKKDPGKLSRMMDEVDSIEIKGAK